MISFLSICDEKLTQISGVTDQDEICNQPRKTIIQGYPTDKVDLPITLYLYFYVWDEIRPHI